MIRDEETEGAAPASPPTTLDDMRAPPPSAGAAASWPRLVEAMKMAWFALLGQRLRTALTLLGVIIGIVSVVMMVALGESSQRVLQRATQGHAGQFSGDHPGQVLGRPGRRETPESDGRRRRRAAPAKFYLQHQPRGHRIGDAAARIPQQQRHGDWRQRGLFRDERLEVRDGSWASAVRTFRRNDRSW